MKVAAILAALPLASAFVAPVPKMAARGRSLQMQKSYPFAEEPGGVKFFPQSAPYWDPLGIVESGDKEHFWRMQHAEIKNGRVAMLAVVDYIVKDFFHIRFPFEFGGVSTQDIPVGLGAIKALPAAGWLQIITLCFLFDVGTEKNSGWYVPDRVPGNVQPDTPLFKAPGDVKIRTKEINNGRLAMIAIMGMLVQEVVSGGELPFETLFRKLGGQ